jgi:hypothetical protein
VQQHQRRPIVRPLGDVERDGARIECVFCEHGAS